MVKWLLMHASELIVSLGLVMDVIGAWILAGDIIAEYKGSRYEHEQGSDFVNGISRAVDGAPPEETQQYKEWVITLRGFRKRGLYWLTGGFFTQLVAAWL